jgi:hypothetical protein
MTRVLGVAANGVALQLRTIEIFGQNILGATTHMRVVFWVAPNRIHHGVVTLSNEKRDGTAFRVSSSWSASRQVFIGVAGTLGAFGADARWRWTLRVLGEH